jgi:N-acyl-D-aspartate/D-glutamate deacylase
MKYDLIIKNALLFDGISDAASVQNIGIKDGIVTAISTSVIPEDEGVKIIDAQEHWVMPGFLEMHSHYDAEIVVAPALKESVRHGVTTIALGSCSISMMVSSALDCADMFTRVEAVPRSQVLPILQEKKTWVTPAQYRQFLEQQALGPNVCGFIGHSDIRAAVLGLERSTHTTIPTEAELTQMTQLLNQALDAGFMGLSVMTTKLDKMDGDRVWSKSLPSTYSSWQEFSRLFDVLRKRQAVLQGAPDAVGKINVFAFLWHAHGWKRKPLKSSLLTALDLKSQPFMHYITRTSGYIANKFLAGNFRWQTLSAPFTLHLEGLDVNAFEEFSAGEILRDFKDDDLRYAKVNDPEFRKAFKKQLGAIFTKGLWHRDFTECKVINCPDKSVEGKTFAQIGKEQNKDAVDAYFDLAVLYREKLLWRTNYGNHRPEIMYKLLSSPYTHIGFADSGAHIRSNAQYNFPLRMLKYARDAQLLGTPFISIEQAVKRLTSDLADWFAIDAGKIKIGARADIAIINPLGLNHELDEVSRAEMEGFGGITRLVKRNDLAVDYTIINGKIAYQKDLGFAADLGQEKSYGRFLPSTEVQ